MREALVASPMVGSGVGGGTTVVGEGAMAGILLPVHSVKLQSLVTPTHSSKSRIGVVHAGQLVDNTHVQVKEALQSYAMVVVAKVATSQ